MADDELDTNVTMNTGAAEDDWYRTGMAAYERLKALRQSAIIIPEKLTNLVHVRRGAEELMVVRVLRGASVRADATLH